MKKILISLLTLVIFPLSIILIISWATIATIQSPSQINSYIKSQTVYDKLMKILPNYMEQTDPNVVLTNQEKSRIIKYALSPQDVSGHLGNISQDFFSWLNHGESFKVDIDLQPVKDKAGSEITSIYKEKYAALPECTTNELLLIQMQGQDEFPTCRIPSEGQYDSLYKNFDPTLVTTDSLNSFPNKIKLDFPESMHNVPTTLKQVKLFLAIATIIDLLLLLLVGYLIRHKKQLLRYLGFVFFFMSLILIAVKYFVFDLINNELTESITFSLAKNEQLKTLVLPLYNTLFSNLKNNLYFISIAILICAIITLIIALFLKKPKQ